MIAHFFKEADVSLLRSARSTIERCLREGRFVQASIGDSDILGARLTQGKFTAIDVIAYIEVFYAEKQDSLVWETVQPDYFAPNDFEGAAKAMILRLTKDSHRSTGLGLSLYEIAKLQRT